MKKILVLGAKGMAGHVITAYLKSLDMYEVTGVARNSVTDEGSVSLDVSDEHALEQLIASRKFDIVINCIGILNKDAEDHPYKSIWYNSYFPHLLEKWGKGYGFKLIHISTDCVFSGKATGAYTETSFKDGVGYYAQSKALGEVINDKDLTFRTSIIGPELKGNGIGLFHWFMQQDSRGTLKGFTQAYWTGVTTIVLARAIHEAIQQDLKGLYQLVYTEKISKFDLISLFNTIFRSGTITIQADDHYKVDKSLVNGRNDFNFTVPSYQDMISDMQDWIQQHPDDYPGYS